MSTSIWGGPESYADDAYPSALLRHLLKQMMSHFAAQGACIALLDENIGQMRIRMHLRTRNVHPPHATGKLPVYENAKLPGLRLPGRRVTAHLEDEALASPGLLHGTVHIEEVGTETSLQQSALFAHGTSYPIGQGLIGYAWANNETCVLDQEEYLALFCTGQPLPAHVVPASLLAVPLQEPMLADEMRGLKRRPAMLGVIILYQLQGPSFQKKQQTEALHYVERFALYLQNDQLQRAQRRTSDYLQRLQEISTAFPTSVKLSDLIETMYQFTTQIVNVSSMLLTLYDRDSERIYDVFAVWNGTRIDGLAEQPVVTLKEDRPIWWHIIHNEKRRLLFPPMQDLRKTTLYHELLSGVWGDQQQAASFLILPIKMFNRVVGSLSLTSTRPDAYRQEEIQVLETMLQIVAVSIENARLYERDRSLLTDARQREAQLAAINSALQSISSVLHVTELLNNLVSSVATVLKANTCVFFQLSPECDELIAQALYAPTSVRMIDDGSGLPEENPAFNQEQHTALIKMIRLPFKHTILEQMMTEGFFYLDAPKLDDLAQKGKEGYAIFLQVTQIRQMLMVPLTYQKEFIGVLAVPTPSETRFFRPKDIGTLLAICAQAVSAIRNAQLFEKQEEASADLKRLNKLKDEFMVTASHELRTPLSAILGYASLLTRQNNRNAPSQILRFANKISNAARQLNALVDNMTEATQIGALDKKLDLDIGPVQVLSAAEIAQDMLALNSKQNVMLEIDSQLWVAAAPLHFRQVLSNLLENAVKYSPPHSPIYLAASAMTLAQVEDLLSEDQITDQLSEEQDDPQLMLERGHTPVVLIRVRDQGEGILPADRLRIFEKFARAPRSLTTPVRGSGLGLYICHRYIETMGGKLWLEESTPDKGSTFSFYLPRIEPPIEAEEQHDSDQ